MLTGLAIRLALALQVAAPPAGEPLPAPTGPHRTGRMTFHWVDRSRPELETSARSDRRELVVYVFYPAEPNERAARAPYMPGADAMRGVWSDAQIARLEAMRAQARERVALLKGSQRFPVVLLSPGGGMKVLTYHTLAEDLASHGYVVAAIDPPYNARAMRLPNGRVLGPLAPSARGWPAPQNRDEELRNYRERVLHWARDMSFVIDQLARLNAARGPFARRLDLARGVGALGHSRGGQVAGTVRLLEPRVCGGINIDGTQGPLAFQQVNGNDGGRQPFMWIQTPPPTPNEERLRRAGRTMAEFRALVNQVFAAWDRQLGSVRDGALQVVINRPGIEHIDFSDEPFWDASLTAQARAAKVKTIADTRRYVRAFMEGCTHGNWGALRALVAAAGKAQPELTAKVYRMPWQR